MKDVIVITRPLTMQVHLGNPKMARIPELTILAMPECEGGGWYMPSDQAEAIVSAWNGFLDNSPEPKAPLPTWAQLVAYWRDRAERPSSVQGQTICDCERGHNGLGISGRECDCEEPRP